MIPGIKNAGPGQLGSLRPEEVRSANAAGTALSSTRPGNHGEMDALIDRCFL